LQKDGKARAVLNHYDISPTSGGPETDLLFVTATNETLLKLHADAGGGLITVGMPGHTDGVVLTMRNEVPAVLLRGPEGATSIHLLAARQMACVKVREGWLREKKSRGQPDGGCIRQLCHPE
jgi:hypothetical protein